MSNLKNDLKSSCVNSAVNAALKRISNHKFCIAADENLLTEQETLRWIFCAGRESETFPKILENMLDYCDIEVISKILRENLDDEYGNGNPDHAHFKHYLDLLKKLNVSVGDFESYNEKSGIALALQLAKSVSKSRNLPLALGYMLVNEGMTPITYSAIRKSCKKHFPFLKTPFFDMHIEVDEAHVADLFIAVDNLPPEDIDEVLFGIDLGERGMAVLLDEVIGTFDNE